MRIAAVVLFLLSFAASSPAWAQKSGEKPLWMYELPLSTEGGEFRRTMGEGKSVQKATQNAIMGYIRNRNFELGLTVSTEGMEALYAATESEAGNYFTNSSSREQEGLNQGTRLKSEENKIRFRVVESYSETSLLGDVKVWCLIWQPEEGASVRPPRLSYATASDHSPMQSANVGYVPLPEVARPFHRPGLAWLAPGAAHLYNKRYGKGVTMLLGSAVLVSVSGGLFLSAAATDPVTSYDPETGATTYSNDNFVKNITGVALMLANVGIYVWSIADAYVSARDARKLGANDHASRSLSVSPWMAQIPMRNGEMATGILLSYSF